MVLSLVEPYDGLRRPMRVSGAPMSDRVNCIFPTSEHDIHFRFMVWILCNEVNGFFPGWGNRIDERTFVYVWPREVFPPWVIWMGLNGQPEWLSDRKDFKKEREVAIFNGELTNDISPH